MAVYKLIKLRRDYAANWTSLNPVLSLGEPGFERDTGKMKIGDGTTPWDQLDYIKVSAEDIVVDPEEIADIVASTLQEGPYIDIDYQDASDVIVISATGVASEADLIALSGDVANLDAALVFKGFTNPVAPNSAPLSNDNGDVWISNTSGIVDGTWTGAAGETVVVDQFIVYASGTDTWTLGGKSVGVDLSDYVLKAEFDPVKDLAEKNEQDIYALSGTTENLKLDIGALSGTVNGHGNSIIVLQSEMLSVSGSQIPDINAAIASLSGSIGSVSGNIINIDADLSSLSGFVIQNSGRIDGLEIYVNDLNNSITGIDSDLSGLQLQITSNDQDIVTLSGMIDNVEGGLNTVSGNLNTLTLVVGNQLTYIQSLSGLVLQNTQDIQTLSGLIDGGLDFKGYVDPTVTGTAPSAPSNGDLYISNTSGTIEAGWSCLVGSGVIGDQWLIYSSDDSCFQLGPASEVDLSAYALKTELEAVSGLTVINANDIITVSGLLGEGVPTGLVEYSTGLKIQHQDTVVSVNDNGSNYVIDLTDWKIEDGHMLPISNANFDIGSAERKVRHLFLSDNSVYMGEGVLSASSGSVVLEWNGEALAKVADLMTVSGIANKAGQDAQSALTGVAENAADIVILSGLIESATPSGFDSLVVQVNQNTNDISILSGLIPVNLADLDDVNIPAGPGNPEQYAVPIYNTGDSAYNVNRITPVHVEDSRVTPPLGGYADGSLGKELTDMHTDISANTDNITAISGGLIDIPNAVTFRGITDPTVNLSAPSAPINGDMWVSDNSGLIDPSWSLLGGQPVLVNQFLLYSSGLSGWLKGGQIDVNSLDSDYLPLKGNLSEDDVALTGGIKFSISGLKITEEFENASQLANIRIDADRVFFSRNPDPAVDPDNWNNITGKAAVGKTYGVSPMQKEMGFSVFPPSERGSQMGGAFVSWTPVHDRGYQGAFSTQYRYYPEPPNLAAATALHMTDFQSAGTVDPYFHFKSGYGGSETYPNLRSFVSEPYFSTSAGSDAPGAAVGDYAGFLAQPSQAFGGGAVKRGVGFMANLGPAGAVYDAVWGFLETSSVRNQFESPTMFGMNAFYDAWNPESIDVNAYATDMVDIGTGGLRIRQQKLVQPTTSGNAGQLGWDQFGLLCYTSSSWKRAPLLEFTNTVTNPTSDSVALTVDGTAELTVEDAKVTVRQDLLTNVIHPKTTGTPIVINADSTGSEENTVAIFNSNKIQVSRGLHIRSSMTRSGSLVNGVATLDVRANNAPVEDDSNSFGLLEISTDGQPRLSIGKVQAGEVLDIRAWSGYVPQTNQSLVTKANILDTNITAPTTPNVTLRYDAPSSKWVDSGAGSVIVGSEPLGGWGSGTVGEALENGATLPISSADDTVTLDGSAGRFSLDVDNNERVIVNQTGLLLNKTSVPADPTLTFQIKDLGDNEFFYYGQYAYLRQQNDLSVGLSLINNQAAGNANRGIWTVAIGDGQADQNDLNIWSSSVGGENRATFNKDGDFVLNTTTGKVRTNTITTVTAASGDPSINISPTNIRVDVSNAYTTFVLNNQSPGNVMNFRNENDVNYYVGMSEVLGFQVLGTDGSQPLITSKAGDHCFYKTGSTTKMLQIQDDRIRAASDYTPSDDYDLVTKKFLTTSNLGDVEYPVGPSPVAADQILRFSDINNKWIPSDAGTAVLGSAPLGGWPVGSVGEAIANGGGATLPISSVDGTVKLDGASNVLSVSGAVSSDTGSSTPFRAISSIDSAYYKSTANANGASDYWAGAISTPTAKDYRIATGAAAADTALLINEKHGLDYVTGGSVPVTRLFSQDHDSVQAGSFLVDYHGRLYATSTKTTTNSVARNSAVSTYAKVETGNTRVGYSLRATYWGDTTVSPDYPFQGISYLYGFYSNPVIRDIRVTSAFDFSAVGPQSINSSGTVSNICGFMVASNFGSQALPPSGQEKVLKYGVRSDLAEDIGSDGNHKAFNFFGNGTAPSRFVGNVELAGTSRLRSSSATSNELFFSGNATVHEGARLIMRPRPDAIDPNVPSDGQYYLQMDQCRDPGTYAFRIYQYPSGQSTPLASAGYGATVMYTNNTTLGIMGGSGINFNADANSLYGFGYSTAMLKITPQGDLETYPTYTPATENSLVDKKFVQVANLSDVEYPVGPSPVTNGELLVFTDTSNKWVPDTAGKATLGSTPLGGWPAGSVGEAISNAGGGAATLPISSADTNLEISQADTKSFGFNIQGSTAVEISQNNGSNAPTIKIGDFHAFGTPGVSVYSSGTAGGSQSHYRLVSPTGTDGTGQNYTYFGVTNPTFSSAGTVLSGGTAYVASQIDMVVGAGVDINDSTRAIKFNVGSWAETSTEMKIEQSKVMTRSAYNYLGCGNNYDIDTSKFYLHYRGDSGKYQVGVCIPPSQAQQNSDFVVGNAVSGGSTVSTIQSRGFATIQYQQFRGDDGYFNLTRQNQNGVISFASSEDSTGRGSENIMQFLPSTQAIRMNYNVGINCAVGDTRLQVENPGLSGTQTSYGMIVGGNMGATSVITNASCRQDQTNAQGFYSYNTVSAGATLGTLYCYRADSANTMGGVLNSHIGYYAGQNIKHGDSSNIGFSSAVQSGESNYAFFSNAQGTQSYMRGNVGIGTNQSQPAYKLVVAAEEDDTYTLRVGNIAGGAGNLRGTTRIGIDAWGPTNNHSSVALMVNQHDTNSNWQGDLHIQMRQDQTDSVPVSKFVFTPEGNLGVNASGVSEATVAVDVNSDRIAIRDEYTPAALSSDTIGEIAWDDDYIWIRTSSGWKKSPLYAFDQTPSLTIRVTQAEYDGLTPDPDITYVIVG